MKYRIQLKEQEIKIDRLIQKHHLEEGKIFIPY